VCGADVVAAGATTIALLRVRAGGHTSEPTAALLRRLLPRMSKGGWVFVDDYLVDATATALVDGLRDSHVVGQPMVQIGRVGAAWRNGQPVQR
jgi:hypothetical protein